MKALWLAGLILLCATQVVTADWFLGRLRDDECVALERIGRGNQMHQPEDFVAWMRQQHGIMLTPQSWGSETADAYVRRYISQVGSIYFLFRGQALCQSSMNIIQGR